MTTEVRKHILVAECHPLVRQMLEEFLSRSGYVVTAVEEAEKAVEVLRQKPVDLLLLADDLPGLHLVLQDLADRIGMPVILLASGFNRETRRTLEESGVSTCVQKPFGLSALATRVREALQGHLRRPPPDK